MEVIEEEKVWPPRDYINALGQIALTRTPRDPRVVALFKEVSTNSKYYGDARETASRWLDYTEGKCRFPADP